MTKNTNIMLHIIINSKQYKSQNNRCTQVPLKCKEDQICQNYCLHQYYIIYVTMHWYFSIVCRVSGWLSTCTVQVILFCQYLSLHILDPFNSCVTKGIALYLYVVMLQHLYLFYCCVTIGFLHVPCPLCRFVSSFLSRYTASNIYCNDGQNRPLPYV